MAVVSTFTGCLYSLLPFPSLGLSLSAHFLLLFLYLSGPSVSSCSASSVGDGPLLGVHHTVTLIAALSACSHAGLVVADRELFRKLLDGSFGFSAGVKHYGCMVDLLGRAGLLDEAVEVIEQMPFEANPVVCGSLLGACRARGDAALSSLAAEKLVQLDPRNAAYRVLLSNTYAALGRWDKAEEVRRLMMERQLGKVQLWAAGSLVQTSKPPSDI